MAGMTESDERLDRVSDKIDDAKGAAKSLAESDVIDPGVVEGEVPASGDEVTGPDDGTDVRGPDVPDSDLSDYPTEAPDDAERPAARES
jgi:hypothetical protein